MAIEVESKLELSRDDFDAVKTAGRITKCVDQLNVYYDCRNVLAEASVTLRIRYASRVAPNLTLKIPKSLIGAKRIASEFEYPIATRTAPLQLRVDADLPADISAILKQMQIDTVKRVGWMRTVRSSVELEGGIFVDLDEVWLPGGTRFFEAEIETAEEAVHDVAVAAVRRFAKSARPSVYSKFERFCAAVRAEMVGTYMVRSQ